MLLLLLLLSLDGGGRGSGGGTTHHGTLRDRTLRVEHLLRRHEAVLGVRAGGLSDLAFSIVRDKVSFLIESALLALRGASRVAKVVGLLLLLEVLVGGATRVVASIKGVGIRRERSVLKVLVLVEVMLLLLLLVEVGVSVDRGSDAALLLGHGHGVGLAV